MVKLPKEMQQKEKNKPKRPQAIKKREGPQFGSRQMRRKMAQQGIEMDQLDATRVIIESSDKTLVINQPEVIIMKQAGQDIYQIIGDTEEFLPDEIDVLGEKEKPEEEPLDESEIKPIITENDIMLVASQANVDPKEAETILKECNGDIAKAILFLKNRP